MAAWCVGGSGVGLIVAVLVVALLAWSWLFGKWNGG